MAASSPALEALEQELRRFIGEFLGGAARGIIRKRLTGAARQRAFALVMSPNGWLVAVATPLAESLLSQPGRLARRRPDPGDSRP